MLTDSKIQAAPQKDKPYRLSDGGSLYLEIKPSGVKSWLYRYRLGKKQGVFVIGPYYTSKAKPPDHVTREAARRKRDEARSLVRQGKNPAQERKNEKHRTIADGEHTFQSVAGKWIGESKPHWSARYGIRVERALARHVHPYIGNRPIRGIDSSDILDIVERIKRSKALTVAVEVRQWISLVFKFAIVRRLATIDHAAPLDGVVRRAPVKHKTPLDEGAIKEFVSRANKLSNRKVTIALLLLLYLFPRPRSIQSAEWAEFNLEAGEWKIGGSKMKMGADFISPLPRQTLALLRELHKLTGDGRWLFPNDRRPATHMDPMTLAYAMRRMGYTGQFSPHSFRATGKTLLLKGGYSDDLTERQLAHAKANAVKASYDFYAFFPERQRMMQHYANMIDGWVKGIAEVKAA